MNQKTASRSLSRTVLLWGIRQACVLGLLLFGTTAQAQTTDCALAQTELTAGRSVIVNLACAQPLTLSEDVNGKRTITGSMVCDGPCIRLKGVHRVNISGDFKRTTPGPLIQIDGGTWDSAFVTIEKASLNGGWIEVNRALNTTIRDTTFTNAPHGIVASYWVNGLTVEGSTFWNLSGSAIQNQGTSQRWTISNNIFEPTTTGQASGFQQVGEGYLFGFNYSANWHGDVTSGGQPWIVLRSGGFFITGNYFGTAGHSTPLIQLSGAQGGTISGNRFEGDIALSFGPGYSWGTTFSGNDVMTPQGVVGYVIGFRAIGNNNFADR